MLTLFSLKGLLTEFANFAGFFEYGVTTIHLTVGKVLLLGLTTSKD